MSSIRRGSLTSENVLRKSNPRAPSRRLPGTQRTAAGWLAAGLALLTLTAAVVVLWLTREALRNEELAARQLREHAGQQRLQHTQQRLAEELRRLAEPMSVIRGAPAARFSGLMLASPAQGALVFGEDKQPAYPALTVADEPSDLQSAHWDRLREAEARGEHQQVSVLAEEIAAEPGLGTAERLAAIQCRVRGLLKAGRNEEAELVALAAPAATTGTELRIKARTLLLIAESIPGDSSRILDALQSLTENYTLPLPSSVRRMAARHLLNSGRAALAPLLERETAASALLLAGLSAAPPAGLRESTLVGQWTLTAEDRSAALIFSKEALISSLSSALGPGAVLEPPGAPVPSQIAVSQHAGPDFPGWMLHEVDDLPSAPQGMAARYAWIGGLSVLALGGLTLFTGLSVRQQMQRARLREDLAASVSHELRTPLASMRLLVDSLLEDDPPDERRTRDYLQLLAQENMRLSRMVENFLTLSRVERSRNPLERHVIAPGKIADRTVAAATGTPAGPRIQMEIAPDLPPISVPADALVTALLNLLDNAAKYSPPEQPITFTISAEGEHVRFAVADRGPGLTKAQIASIWQPFVRQNADAATPGCGLGLCIVRAIATQCGGEARVDSTPGAGSTFSILVPRH